ncbi:Uncharacterised protein [Mycobacteroides abscessus subsp. abscessus]|nr:Uncharacterised protein [Mycobacteroides abscessus subsp. abscessus]
MPRHNAKKRLTSYPTTATQSWLLSLWGSSYFVS